MKYYLLIAIALSLTFTGCSNPLKLLLPSSKKVHKKKVKRHVVRYEKPTAAKLPVFQETMKNVALSTKNDANYNKMALDSPEKKAWFKSLMYKLWDRQITRRQFIYEGLKKYPAHKYEFNFVANGFQKRS